MQRMRQVQAAREKAFEPLAEILGQRAELQHQLAELDAPYGEAFAAAEAAGWTAVELQAIGAEQPVKPAKVRTRNRRTAPKGAPEDTAEESASAPPAGATTAP